MLEVLRNLDRRWIFFLMFLAVALPTYFAMKFPQRITPPSKAAFDVVEALPEGSPVLIAVDYDPGSEAELRPMLVATMRHLALRKCKIYILGLWPNGVPLTRDAIARVFVNEFKDQNMVYGRDYVYLGYKPGNESVIKVITTDLKRTYPSDSAGKSLDEIPMTRDMRNIQDMKLIVSISAGTPGAKEWVQYAAIPFKIPMIAGSTGVQANQLFPYYPNQIQGMMAAIKGAAEYEELLGKTYTQYQNPAKSEGLRLMAVQVWGHIAMVLFVIVGNVIFFMTRSKGARP